MNKDGSGYKFLGVKLYLQLDKITLRLTRLCYTSDAMLDLQLGRLLPAWFQRLVFGGLCQGNELKMAVGSLGWLQGQF